MRLFRTWRRSRWLHRHPIPEYLWAHTLESTPLLRLLPAGDIARLRELAAVFVQEKTWMSTPELQVTDVMQVRTAALASLLVLELDLDWYRGWETIILYPAEFVQRRREVDAGGLEHQWDEVRAGEAWERGPVVLSWTDVAASGRIDGYNVVIHELAHKLDMLNGPPDGFPPLHRDMSVRRWTRVFTAAFDELNERLDRGEETSVDPYAAEHPAEFFSVLSEYFFELPELLSDIWPELYGELAAFYRQDPLRWPGRRG
ncbi:MAG: zinc-dependent peptidase [Gammaproteobacteria bacterium]|jgi:Mlc titration factor MtfA (ptsG expression regulator)|nr:zinc-dependent peptidase [Gammaproteobacteria bacterium]